MKLTIATALTAAVVATSASSVAANARYEAITPERVDTPVLNIPDSNKRYQAVSPDQEPAVQSQDDLGTFEDPSVPATRSASEGLIEYYQENQRLQDIYR